MSRDKDLDEYEDAILRRPRWKRRLTIAGIILLVVAIAAEWFVASKIAATLHSTVAAKLDADLRLGPVLYIPPYGVIVFRPQLVRGSDVLVKASRISMSLAQFPREGEPIIVSALSLENPELNLTPNAFRRIGKPGGKHLAPRKLSEMLRLNEVRVRDGRLTWRDPARGDVPPMTWEGIALDLDTVQQSPSSYTFYVKSRAHRTADASASGAIDVDSLLLELKNANVSVRAEPEPAKSPLPQAMQEWLKAYRVNGNVTINGHGTIPLRDLKRSAFATSIKLDDALAEIPAAQMTINRAKAELACNKKASTPVNLELKSIEISTGSGTARSVMINGGQLLLDAENGRWTLSELNGYVFFERASTDGATSMFAAAPPQTPGVERHQPSGRADFSANASGPFRIAGKFWDAIDHEIVIHPRGASFVPKGFARRIEDISGGEIRIRGGMMIFQEVTGKYGDDFLHLRAARLPLEGFPQVQQWREISGSITFSQPRYRYSPALDNIFDVLNPSGTFLIAGSFTSDKGNPTTKSAKSYDLIVSSDKGAFALTKHRIPLEKVRGDATVTPDGVILHGAQAELLGGTMTMSGQWTKPAPGTRGYDGDLTLRDVDLARLKSAADDPPEINLRGKLSGQATFSGSIASDRPAGEELKHLRAKGEMELVEAAMFDLPVLKQIFERMKVKEAANVGEAAAVFDLADGVVTLTEAGVGAPALGLQGKGKLSLDGTIDANVVAAPLADWKEKLKETKIPLVSNVAGQLAGGVQKLLNTATGTLLYNFQITGNVKDKVEVATIPTPALSEGAAIVFGRMLTPRRDQRPLDWFRRDNPSAQAK